MSLFPAYPDAQSSTHSDDKNETNEEWLKNSSFAIDVKCITERNIPDQEATTSANSEKDTYIEKKCIATVLKAKIAKEPKEECFYEDKKGTREFLSVKTISRPAVSKYRVFRRAKSITSNKKRKYKRYYKAKQPEVNLEADIPIRDGQDLTQKIAEFNRRLTIETNNVKLWIEFIEFQDLIFGYEKTYKKGSVSKGLRLNAEKKLAILDKALGSNPKCEELMRKRIDVISSVYPADELQAQLGVLVDRDPSSVVWWQGYIEATQCSMSHCTSPAVLELYTQCLAALHKIRRISTMEKATLEENILKMLYQCGLFLKQSGLFERLWTMLRMYLDLNLAPLYPMIFNISSKVNERQLVELEDIVLSSNLPIHELWLRVEKMRESCRWIPFSGEVCEDPQRLVFPEDVNQLIHPITMPENTFRLTATILTLIKIPLLPCRHTTMDQLGLDYVPWSLDSIESVLPFYFPIYPIDLTDIDILNGHKLAVGPQYLKALPAQEEYLNFVLDVMFACVRTLSRADQKAMTIWWFRFQRLLIVLNKNNYIKLTSSVLNKFNHLIKRVLKDNRSNVLFYCEYALIQKELVGVQSCVDVLKTALTFNRLNVRIFHHDLSREDPEQCFLTRTLVETLIYDGQKDLALKYLCEYILGRELDAINEEILREASSTCEQFTIQVLAQQVSRLPTTLHFFPTFLTELVICHGWFVYLTAGPIKSGVFIERALGMLRKEPGSVSWQEEVLYEFYVAMLAKHSFENKGYGTFKILDDTIFRAIAQYPNNIFFVSILLKTQSVTKTFGPPFWNLQKNLLKTNRALPILFLILIANYILSSLQNECLDTITGGQFEMTTSLKNKMYSLFRTVTNPEMPTRRCGLIWRLYLQFVHKWFDLKLCRDVYYGAVEECPWLKALYIDAAIYIPEDIAQIQDLLVEKELRLHVTPEELDVLRS